MAVGNRIIFMGRKNEEADLQQLPIEDVFKQLECTREGLSSATGNKRLEECGPNKIEEKKKSKLLKFLGYLWNPLTWVMEVVAILAISLPGGGENPPDWQTFAGVVVLLVINATASFIVEDNAGSAAASVMANLALKTKVIRNGIWTEADASILVPGDIIGIKMGGVVPADVRLLEGDPLEIDQSLITGECITVTKNPGDFVYSGSTCKRGEIEAVVCATGIHTYFGKAAHLEDNTTQVGRFQKVRTAVGYFCVCTVAIGMVAEMIVMYAIQKKRFRDGIGNLFVILIGGIPIAIPTVLSMTMAIGSHRLSELGAIVKRMTAIEEMACMDVLCSDNKGTLTLNKFSVDRDLVEVFAEGVDKDHVLLLAARASRTENQDAIDAAIVGMLSDPKQARAGIREVHFQSFNPVYKRTAITYIDHNDNWHCVTKGSPKQIVTLCNCKQDVKFRVHSLIKKFAEDGFLSLGVARQEIPEKAKDGLGGPWEFVGLLPLFDSPRPDSAASIRRAVDLGVNVKMITRDQLAIAKETGRRLGMGTNMYPSSSLLGSLPANGLAELIEKADGFTGVFPEHKYEIVNKLKERKHICGMVGDGVDDVPALNKADIGIAVIDATHAAKSASNVIFTEPGLRVIVSAVLTSRSMVQTINNYFIYSVSKTIHMVLGFMLIASIWNFNFSPIMVLIIVILIEGSIVPISKDRVEPSPVPESCKLKEIVATGIVLGCYLAVTSVFFSWLMRYTAFFDPAVFRPLKHSEDEMMAALFLQISITSQALILITRTRVNPVDDCPGLLLVSAVFFAQFVSTLIAVYADWGFAHVKGIGWLWAYIIWSYDGIVLIYLVWIKTKIQNFFSEEAAVTTKRDNHEDERETQGDLMDQRVSHELQPLEITPPFAEGELPEIVDQAGRQV